VREGYSFKDWLLSRPFYDAQPDWSRKLGWFVGIPAWLAWGYFILSGTLFTHRVLAMTIFGIFAAVALVQNFYFFFRRPSGRDVKNV